MPLCELVLAVSHDRAVHCAGGGGNRGVGDNDWERTVLLKCFVSFSMRLHLRAPDKNRFPHAPVTPGMEMRLTPAEDSSAYDGGAGGSAAGGFCRFPSSQGEHRDLRFPFEFGVWLGPPLWIPLRCCRGWIGVRSGD